MDLCFAVSPTLLGSCSTWPGCGQFDFVCPMPGMWACGLFLVCLSRAVGFICLVVGGVFARMWVFGSCVSGDFCFGLMPIFP